MSNVNHNDVFERIIEHRKSMSKAQNKIANYIVNNDEVAPFLTASKLAQKAGVGESTIIRFAVFLGYEGYPDMQRLLQEAMTRKWTQAEKFEKTTSAVEKHSTLIEIMHDDIINVKATLKGVNEEQFQAAVDAFVNANRIFIIAYRSAKSLGVFLEFYLDLVLQNTELILQADGVSEHLLDITENDLVIGLGFQRYTKRTVEVLKYVKSKKAKTIVMTDRVTSPLYSLGDYPLLSVTEINSFINSFTSSLSLINALITAVTRQEHDKVKDRLENLENSWDAFDVFTE
jgi:DNA-binding MurR/RpiR family transcriptional regulator